MLLDTDMTITNSPDASSSQVHNIVNKIEKKLTAQRDLGNAHQQVQQHCRFHSQEQPKTKNFNSLINTNCVQLGRIGIKYNNLDKHAVINNRKVQKTLPTVTTVRSIGYSLSSKVNKGSSQSSYNPYADENDSTSKFQLSKSISGSHPIGGNSLRTEISTYTTKTLNKQRFFGNDRTNLVAVDRQISNRPSNVINLRRENFYTFNITNNTIRKTSNISGTGEQSTNSQLIQENPVMFRNYDLNDEYWLNFE